MKTVFSRKRNLIRGSGFEEKWTEKNILWHDNEGCRHNYVQEASQGIMRGLAIRSDGREWGFMEEGLRPAHVDLRA